MLMPCVQKKGKTASDERHSQFLTLLTHAVGPDARLNLADMRLVEQHEAEPALSDTASDGERQFPVEQFLEEIVMVI